MVNYLWFVISALFEIAGCYAFWMWWRMDKSALWLLPGIVSLVIFAFFLSKVEVQFAGRAYAAYGGIYIICSLVWLSVMEHTRPLLTDYFGVFLCLAGASIILFGPRFTGN